MPESIRTEMSGERNVAELAVRLVLLKRGTTTPVQSGWPKLEGDLAQDLQHPSNLMPSLTSIQPAPSCPHTALLKSVHEGFQT
ncbi:hypothetical protein ATANTOWER_005326 [Ataeniobius toweri]|uniref:Uncharacterized protein n=1 Tax=Ataeniobius toweri TaxID=208326 RepID=A0ABU7B7H7_9TELE|nr:hypothetical protein [Ataeniobius toweri]